MNKRIQNLVKRIEKNDGKSITLRRDVLVKMAEEQLFDYMNSYEYSEVFGESRQNGIKGDFTRICKDVQKSTVGFCYVSLKDNKLKFDCHIHSNNFFDLYIDLNKEESKTTKEDVYKLNDAELNQVINNIVDTMKDDHITNIYIENNCVLCDYISKYQTKRNTGLYAASEGFKNAIDLQQVYNKLVEIYKTNEKVTLSAAETVKKESSENSEIKVVLNDDKNGVELYFNSKPSEEVRNNLKANGFRWSKYNKCWYAKQSEDTLNFANSFTNISNDELKDASKEYKQNKELELQNKIDEININDIESYIVPEEVSKRENENAFFRTSEINHTKILQNKLLEANNQVVSVLNSTDNINIKYRLITSLQRYKRDYSEGYIKYLTHKGNNPSWMVTGRDGRNYRRDQKMNDRQTSLLFKLDEYTNKFNQILKKCKSDIKKELKEIEKNNINKVVEIPKFNKIKIELDQYSTNIFDSNNKKLKQVNEYKGYYIFKNWGCYRIYDSKGNEVYSAKTNENLDVAKRWLVYKLSA